MTEMNAERLKDSMPPQVWEQKMKELELQNAERKAPPVSSFIKNPWMCSACSCLNADELSQCADCKKDKPVGNTLDISRAAANLKVRSLEKEKLNATHDPEPTPA